MHASCPEFSSRSLHKGGRRETTSQNCPLTSIHALQHLCLHIQIIYTHACINKLVNKQILRAMSEVREKILNMKRA